MLFLLHFVVGAVLRRLRFVVCTVEYRTKSYSMNSFVCVHTSGWSIPLSTYVTPASENTRSSKKKIVHKIHRIMTMETEIEEAECATIIIISLGFFLIFFLFALYEYELFRIMHFYYVHYHNRMVIWIAVHESYRPLVVSMHAFAIDKWPIVQWFWIHAHAHIQNMNRPETQISLLKSYRISVYFIIHVHMPNVYWVARFAYA